MNRDKLYLSHIQNAISKIEIIAGFGREKFLADFTMSDTAIKNFMVIGEATKNVSEQTKARQPQIPWKKVAGFRDILIHNYFGTDLEEVWRIIQFDLSDLHKAVDFLLAE